MPVKSGTNLHERIIGPAVAVDTVVMTIYKEKLEVLLLRIGNGPYKDKWSVPGGLIQLDETPESAAIRVLNQKTNISNNHLEQLYTFGDIDRDIRGHIISVAYILLLDNPEKYNLKTLDFYKDIQWTNINELPEMAFDHKKIINYAYQRLQDKLEYSTIAYSLLPKEFTLTEMQKVYEIVLDKELDKRNFRKKIMDLDIIEPIKKYQRGPYRPAQLYKFSKRKLQYTD